MSTQILIYPWHSYNYADVEETFKKLGCEIDHIPYHLDDYDVDNDFQELCRKLLRQKHYDFVFTINYFPVLSEVCEELGEKYVCWTCDNPLIAMYHKSVFNSCNFIFTFDQTNYAEFRSKGVPHIYYLPLAVDADRIDRYLDTVDDLPLYAGDISFVGSLYEKNTYDRLSHRLPDYLRGYLEAVICAQKNVSGGSIIESMLTPEIMLQIEDHFQLKKSADSFSSLALIFSTTVLGFKIASEVRRESLVRLGREHQTVLYTNSRINNIVNVEYRGEVDYYTQMPKVFRASRINLNFTIPNIVSGLPLRAWDILGARGFLLTNYQAEFPLYFKRGRDYDYFESTEELLDKCAFYLEHDEIRRRTADSGFEKVRAEHTYTKRVGQLLSMVKSEPDSNDPMLFQQFG